MPHLAPVWLRVLSVLLACTALHPLLAPREARGQTTTYRSIPLDCGGWFSGFAAHSSGRLYGFGDVFGVWRSDDAGQSWQSLQNNFTTNNFFIQGVAVAAGNADSVVFLESGSPINSNVFKSTDGGTTWTNPLSALSLRQERGGTPLFFHPSDDNELCLIATRSGFTGKLWRSLDAGLTWSKMGGAAFDTIEPTTVYAHPSFPNQIFVGAAAGLYLSVDRGVTFTLIWNNGGANNPAFPEQPPTVKSIVRRTDGVTYFAANIAGYRLTATDYANPATYTATATVNRVHGQGPINSAVLPNGDFVTGDNAQYLKRSNDGGLSWFDLGQKLLTPPTPPWALAATSTSIALGGRDQLVVDPTNSSRWFMTGGKSPVISLDSGGTWKFPPNQNGLAGVMTYRPSFPTANPTRVLIPCSDQGLFVVDDGGYSGGVTKSSNQTVYGLNTYHDVMSSADGGTLVAAGVDQGSNNTSIIRSTDGGTTWTRLNLSSSGLPLSWQGVTRCVANPTNIDDYLVLLGYDTDYPNNNPGLWRTQDGGVTFTQATGIPAGVDTGERYHHENSYLVADGVTAGVRYLSLRAANLTVAERGFYKSTDGGSSWTKSSGQPFDPDWILSLGADRGTAGRIWVAGGHRGVKRSDDGGLTWNAFGNFTAATQVDVAHGRVAVWGRRTGDDWNKLYYSPDNGATWSEKTGPGHRYAFIRDLAVDPYRAGQIWIAGISINVINPPATIDAPVLAVTPAQPAYGMAPGTTATLPLTLANPGTQPLTWSVASSVASTYASADSINGGPTYAWLDAVTGGTSILSGANDAVSSAITLPFTVPYFGVNHTTLRVSSNGFVTLGTTAPSSSYPTNVGLPAAVPGSAPANLIAPLWDDLRLSGGSAGVFYKQTSADTFVVTFRDVQYRTSSSRRATFQVVFKSSGQITFQYQSSNFNSTYGIGIQNATGSQYIAIANNNAYLTDGRAITFTPPTPAFITGITPSSGTLAADGTQALSLGLSSAGLLNGQNYDASLTFTSNDPYNPTRVVPVSLSVTTAPYLFTGQSVSGVTGASLSYTLQGNNAPTSYALASGSLPPGITLNPTTGALSGTPTAAGTYAPAFIATNANGSSNATTVAFTITAPPIPVVAASQAANGLTGASFSYAIQATQTPTSYALSSGSLPPGLTLNTTTGVLGGLPTTLGTYTPAFTATNAFGTSAPVVVTITISSPSAYSFDSTQADFLNRWIPTLSSGTPAWAETGIVTTGGVGNTGHLATSSSIQSALLNQAYGWAGGETYIVSVYFKSRVTAGSVAAGGGLRVGLADDNTGTFQSMEYIAAGINTTSGDQSQLVLVSRQSGTLTAPGPNLGALTDNTWYQLTATFTKSPTAGTFTAVVSLRDWGADGLTGGAVLGASGTLTATGLTSLYASTAVYAGFSAANNGSGNGVRGLDTFGVTMPTPVPVLAANQNAEGVVGTAFSYQIAATHTPSSYALASGALPLGVALNTATGVLSGLPSAAGVFTPAFTATNAGGASAAVTITLTIAAPAPGTAYGFNLGQADFETAFNETAGWGAFWNASAGVGGSGGLTTDSSERAALLPASTLTFTTAGQAVELSVTFKARVTAGTTNTAGGEGLRLGLNRVNTPLLASGGYLAAGIAEASTNSVTSALSAESRNNVPGTTSSLDGNALTLVDNEWYTLDATITYTGGTAFTLDLSLYGLGASGTATPVLLDTFTTTRSGLDSLVGTPLYAGFQGRSAGGAGGVRTFDDFYAGLAGAEPATGVQTFRTAYDLAADGSQDLLTPAGDGVPSLLKYAFNMLGTGDGQASTLSTPNAAVLTAAGSAGLPLVGTGTGGDVGKLQLTYIRRTAASDSGITYAVEFSDALASWAVNASAVESVASINATFERVTVTDSVPGPAKRFVRVRVTAN